MIDNLIVLIDLVDGVVVERGKPHLVQDAAVQVFTAGRHLRSILSMDKKANEHFREQTERRRCRRQSWIDLNEYHSVPYYQYSRSLRLGSQQSIQCNLDQHQSLSQMNEEEEEHFIEENSFHYPQSDHVKEVIHYTFIPEERIQVSMMTQTE